MFSRNSDFEFLRRHDYDRRHNYNHEISFFDKRYSRKKRFRKHYILLAHLSITRFFNLRYYINMF